MLSFPSITSSLSRLMNHGPGVCLASLTPHLRLLLVKELPKRDNGRKLRVFVRAGQNLVHRAYGYASLVGNLCAVMAAQLFNQFFKHLCCSCLFVRERIISLRYDQCKPFLIYFVWRRFRASVYSTASISPRSTSHSRHLSTFSRL